MTIQMKATGFEIPGECGAIKCRQGNFDVINFQNIFCRASKPP